MFGLFKKREVNPVNICPKCLERMIVEESNYCTIKKCEHCQLIWIDDSEIDEIIRMAKVKKMMTLNVENGA